MTAVVAISAVTKAKKLESQRGHWIDEATQYMGQLGMFNLEIEKEYVDAYQLAESLWDTNDVGTTVKEAVQEELSYWGE